MDRRRTLCVAVLLTGSALGCATSPQTMPKTAPGAAPPLLASEPQPTGGNPPALSLIDPRLRAAWPDNHDSTAWFGSGGYQIYARRPGDFVAISAPTAGAVDDVVVSGAFRKTGGPPGGGYGLIVRDRRAGLGDGVDQSGQFIVAAVGDRGQVGIWRRADDRWLDLLPWTDSQSVHPGSAANELTVDIAGSHLRFDVNGVRVASVESPLASGRVGIFVGGDLNQVLVERLVVRPQSAAASPNIAPAHSNGATTAANGAATRANGAVTVAADLAVARPDFSPAAADRATASTAGAAAAAASTATPRSDPATEARELTAAQSRLTEVSAQLKHASDATGGTPEQGVRWREELGGVLDAVHQLTQDVGNDYARGNREAARVQRVTALLGQLEGEVAAALDGFSDGLDGPRSPVTNRAVLDGAAAHLASAGRTAEQIRTEVQDFQSDLPGSRR